MVVKSFGKDGNNYQVEVGVCEVVPVATVVLVFSILRVAHAGTKEGTLVLLCC